MPEEMRLRLKMECLELAVKVNCINPVKIEEEAQKYWDWLNAVDGAVKQIAADNDNIPA